MPTIVIDTKNKKQEKIIQAFLDSLEVSYYTEAQEEQALYNAMKKGKKTKLLSPEEKKKFVKTLNNGK
jgi:type II secretory pathway predicted ATPase ExeA